MGTRARGRDRNRHRTPTVTRLHAVQHVSEPPERWRGATSAGRQSQVATWPAGTKGNTPHGTGLGVGSRDTSLTHSTGQGSGTLWHTTCTDTGSLQQHTCQDVVCMCVSGVPSEVGSSVCAYLAPGWDPQGLWTEVGHGLPGSACTFPVLHGCASSCQ